MTRAQKSLEPNSDRAGLRYFLNESQKLPAGQRIAPIDEAINKAGGVEPFLDQLYANTKIADLASRKAMMDETTAQLAALNDSISTWLRPLAIVDGHRASAERAWRVMSCIRPCMEAEGFSGGRLYPTPMERCASRSVGCRLHTARPFILRRRRPSAGSWETPHRASSTPKASSCHRSTRLPAGVDAPRPGPTIVDGGHHRRHARSPLNAKGEPVACC